MSFQKVDFFKFTSFQKIPCFFKNSARFKNSPFEKKSTFSKLRLFQEKSTFDTKFRFLTQNTVHRHKHLFFPNAFPYICHSLPLSTSKTCRIHAFNRTISMFDINYRDQKLLCITNLIPVGRPRTKFRTFLKRSEY